MVPVNQGQAKVSQEPWGGERGSTFSTQASASRVPESCCLSIRIFPSFLLEQSSGAHSGVADASSFCLPLAWPIPFTPRAPGRPGFPLLRGTERALVGLTGEFTFSSKVGSSLLVLLVSGWCLSNSYFHFIRGLLSLAYQGAWSTPSRSCISQGG